MSEKVPVAWVELVRGGQGETNVTSLSQGLGSALSGLCHPDVSFVLVNDCGSLRSFIRCATSVVSSPALTQYARLLGCSLVSVDPPVLHDNGGVSVVSVNEHQDLEYALSQAGADPFAGARLIGDVLPDGAWVCVTVRLAHRFERQRYTRYVRFLRPGQIQHYFVQTKTPFLARLYCGGCDDVMRATIAETVLSSWTGFDLDTRCVSLSERRERRVLSFLALMWVLVGFALHRWDAWHTYVSFPLVGIAYMCALLCLILWIVYARGIIPSRFDRLSSHLPPPRFSLRPHRKGRKEQVLNDGRIRPAFHPLYPLGRYALPLSPIMAGCWLQPQTGGRATLQRQPPAVLRETRGAMVGVCDNLPVFISDTDTSLGVAVVGSPGSGKTVFLQGLVASMFAEQARPSGRAGAPGKNNSVIVFEIKNKSVNDYCELHREVTTHVGQPNPLWVIRPGEPSCPDGIDLFPHSLGRLGRASLLTDILSYEAGSDAVGHASREALMNASLAAQYVDEEVLASARGHLDTSSSRSLTSGRSFIYYTHLLLTGEGDDTALVLAGALRDKLLGLNDDDAVRALGGLETLYGKKMTPAARRDATKAPRNKLRRLIDVDHIFSSTTPDGRAKPSWEYLLDNSHNILILTSGDGCSTLLSSDHEKLLCTVYAYTLQRVIQAHCGGWEDERRWVTPVFDELSVIGETSPEIVDWARNKGRSYGVRPIYATQNPDQLEPSLRSTLLTFPTFVSFKADSAGIAREIADRYSIDGSQWDSADIYNLPPYHAIVSTRVDGQSYPAFTVETLWWKRSLPMLAPYMEDRNQ